MDEAEKEAIRAWAANWKYINEVQLEEQRKMSMERRFALTRAGFRPHPRRPEEEAEIEEVRARWLKLKRPYLA